MIDGKREGGSAVSACPAINQKQQRQAVGPAGDGDGDDGSGFERREGLHGLREGSGIDHSRRPRRWRHYAVSRI